MKKRVIALMMALTLVTAMTSTVFASQSSEQSGDLSGILDLVNGIAQSAGSESQNNEEASDSSGLINGLGDLFSNIADSQGEEAGGQEQTSDIMSGLSDLITTITGSINAETEEDVVDEEIGAEIAGTIEGTEEPAAELELGTAAGIEAADPDMEYDTLGDWDIKVPVPDGVTAILDSDGYTLYVTDEQSIPYVRVNSYGGYADVDELISDLISVMETDHEDLEVLAGPESIEVDGREFCEIVFTYGVQGYPVTDVRVITMVNGRSYMYTAKEVAELELYVGDLLETVALGSIYLSEENPEPETEIGEPPIDLPPEPVENELYWGLGLEAIDEYELEGDFITFDEVGLQMWLPDMLTPGTLPAEQPNPELFLGYYTTADDSAYASVVFQPSSEVTLDGYKELLLTLGDSIEDIEDYVINDMPFIGYFIPSGDSMCLATIVEGKGLVEFAFSPISDEEFGAYSEIMGVSIQEIE